MTPQAIIQTGHELFERIDKETIKQLCVSCGGKGFYLLIQGVPGICKPIGEIQPCDECEDGFKYKNLLVEDHGNT